jgi:hypothetical protein
LSEIADGNGRAALLVARIGLHDWLNGKMVRTMFVTEPHGIRKTVEALDAFADLPREGDSCFDPDLWTWRNLRLGRQDDYGALCAEFAEVLAGRNDRYAPLIYGRGLQLVAKTERWLEVKNLQDSGMLIHAVGGDLNKVCAKTPTPSTLLDVWETTQEFFEFVPEILAQSMAKRTRAWIEVKDEPRGLHGNEALDVTIDGAAVELVYQSGKRSWVLDGVVQDLRQWAGKQFASPGGPCMIAEAGAEDKVAYPWRTILTSPDLFLALVPADQAIDLTQRIYAEWRQRFGKEARGATRPDAPRCTPGAPKSRGM